MHAHIVLAHPEPRSFNANLAGSPATHWKRRGWSVPVSDLYAIGFDPCEKGEHYAPRQNPGRFDVQAEQHHASDQGACSPHRSRPKSTGSTAPICSSCNIPCGGICRRPCSRAGSTVSLIYGEVYASQKRFERGRWVGKRAMISVTVATSPEETYAFDGRSGDIDLLLWPVNFSLAYVGFTVLAPFVAYGVEAGLRYSETSVLEARLRGVEQDFRDDTLRSSIRERSFPTIGWPNGGRRRITPEAPVHSPFIRRKQHLEIE